MRKHKLGFDSSAAQQLQNGFQLRLAARATAAGIWVVE
jgi:hypothetical protein